MMGHPVVQMINNLKFNQIIPYRIHGPRLDLVGKGVHEGGGHHAGAAARLVAHGLGTGELEGVAQVAQQACRRRQVGSVD